MECQYRASGTQPPHPSHLNTGPDPSAGSRRWGSSESVSVRRADCDSVTAATPVRVGLQPRLRVIVGADVSGVLGRETTPNAGDIGPPLVLLD